MFTTRIIDEKKRLFKKSKDDLEKQAGRSLSNKETKSLRKSLAPALDKIHEVTEVPDTPVPDDEKEGSFVTRRSSKSKGGTLPVSTFSKAQTRSFYRDIDSTDVNVFEKLKLPGDTLYGSLEDQLELVKQMKKKENASDDGEEASKDSDGGDADERLKLGSSGSTLEPGQLLQLSDDSIPLYNLSDTSVSPSKEDNDENEGSEDSDDKESDVSKEFDTLAEATLGEVSPQSVSKLVNRFEDHMKGGNKRGRGNSTTPESKSGSPPLTKKQAKKARQKQRKQSEKNSGISDANVMLTKEFFMKSDDFPSLNSPKK